MDTRGKGYPWKYSLYMMAYYLSTSVYLNYINLYFKSLNLNTTQISMLMSAIPLISIVAQPMWGSLGDRMKHRNTLLRILAASSAVSIWLFLMNPNFWYLLLVVLLFSAFFTALQPLGDSIILEALHDERRPFGPIRMTGCLVFAISSRIVGGFLNERMNWVVYLTSGMLVLVFISTYALPDVKGHQREKNKTSIFSLLKDGELRGLLIFITLLQVTMGYFYSFFSVHFTSLPGGTSALLGWCYLVSALSEVPFLLLADKLFDKLGAGKLMCISALALTVRWIILGTITNVMWVVASQVLHGWGFIVMTVSMSKYVSATVPEELRARGQMLLAVVGFGVARVVGSLGGGLLANGLGMQHGFYVTAGVAALALCVFAPKYMKRAALNGQ